MESSYQNNNDFKQVSNIISNVFVLLIVILFSRILFYNPFTVLYIVIFFYIITIVCYFMYSIYKMIENIEIESSVVIQEKENIVEEKPIISLEDKLNKKNNSIKYKKIFRKFKNIQKELLQTKNEINMIRQQLEKEKSIKDQEVINNIRDFPIDDDEIIDNIIEESMNEMFENEVQYEVID